VLRPHIRMPLWAAVALPAAAYVIRSLLRGGDFRPDLPWDLIAFGLLAIVILAVAVARSRTSHDGDGGLTDEMDGDDTETGKDG